MIEVVEYLSLFLWIIYLFLAIYREVRKKSNIKEILNKPFQFIRIDNLFFLIVYLFYNDFARREVIPYLYLFIIITSLVYLIYDLADNYGFSKIKKSEYINFLVGFVIFLIIGSFLVIYNNVLFISKITLIINLFIPVVIGLLKIMKNN